MFLHRDYIHIQNIFHIPCTQKRQPIPHSQEWVNNILLIRDRSENIDHAIKRIDITKRLSADVYALASLSEACDVIYIYICIYIYIYIYQIMGLIPYHEYLGWCYWQNNLNIVIPTLQWIERLVYWFHPCLSVRLWTGLYLLYIFNNTCQIHFIFTHVIKVCRVWSFDNIKNWTCGKFFEFVILTLSCFDLGSNMNQ